MPHGYCLRWDAPLLFVFIAGNLGIAIAYFIIPAALRYFIGKRADLPYPHIFKLFAAFILSCGITHLAKIWTLYYPHYWMEASIDLFTAGVSLVTAFLLWPLIPKALALKSPRELEEANRKLAREVEDRAKAEAAAETARDEAVEASKLKSQFVANVSHEVRTPLTGVIGLAELITQAPELSANSREMADRLFFSSKELLRVLNDLLDFSKLEAGRVSLDIEPVLIGELMSDVVALIQPLAKQKHLTLEVKIDSRVPEEIKGDRNKIFQTLLNLAQNAVKFTNSGGTELSVDMRDQKMVRFQVIDTGIGISESIRSRLFEPFVQGQGSIDRKYGGTGLGLSISKGFVELMSGEIGLSSIPGEGTAVWFTVPVDLSKEDEQR